MAKILLQTVSVKEDENTYRYDNIYYSSDARNGLNALIKEFDRGITEKSYTIQDNTVLDSYCTIHNGDGKKATAISDASQDFLYRIEYSDSAECAGISDLTLLNITPTPTTTLTSDDGVITVYASSSAPPISIYIPSLGSRTAPGAEVLFTFNNVKPGTYAARLQDANNNQLTTKSVTVSAGQAPGQNIPGPLKINWAKYEIVPNPRSFDLPWHLEGIIWDNYNKQSGTTVSPPLTYPVFYQYQDQYLKGSVVTYKKKFDYATRYYRASVDLIGKNYSDNKNKIPYPDDNGITQGVWEELTPDNINYFSETYQETIKNNKGDNEYLSYPSYSEGRIVRYGFDTYYKAKKFIDSRLFVDKKNPKPTYKKSNDYWEYLTNWPGSYFTYVIPESQPIDAYFIGTIYRQWFFHLQNPDLPWSEENRDRFYYEDTDTKAESTSGDLRIIDIIKNDIDESGATNGSAWIIATSPSLPLKYQISTTNFSESNDTGQFENLAPGTYEVLVTDAQNRRAVDSFEIEDRYRPRWRLLYSDLKGVNLETYIFERDWEGDVTDVVGTGSPVELSWDSGSSKAGYLPESIGANLVFNLRTQVAQQFVDTILKDDRSHRVDHYRAGKIQFRGYVNSTSYSEKLLGPNQEVQLTATDGLGDLRNTFFLNHKAEKQAGRTNLLSTLLSCLSRCDVNFPLNIGLNLRDRLMAETGDPLQLAYGHREAYQKQDSDSTAPTTVEDTVDMRTVVDAILRNFNAFLYQREGAWYIVSLNEAPFTYDVRSWSPAGKLIGNTTGGTAQDALRILPPTNATESNELFWINANQNRTTIASANVVKATVPLLFQDNLLKNGGFQDWSSPSKPLDWTLNGTIGTSIAKGEKAGERAVKISGYTGTIQNGSYLLSSEAPHLTGQEEEVYELKVKAKTESAIDPYSSEEVTVKLLFQIVCDGQPYGEIIEFELSSKDKWKENKVDLPLGLPGQQVRIRVLNPISVSGNSVTYLSSVALSIRPFNQDWSETDEDHISRMNEISQTGIKLEDVELVHADLPTPPGANDRALKPLGMDIYAWKHALSLEDYTATWEWKRPRDTKYTSLLLTAANDRISLRLTATDEITGEVSGPGFNALSVGVMLDLPTENISGRFMVISCFKREKDRIAQITLKKLAPGSYGEETENLTPNNARIANINGVKNYRVANSNGEKLFRVANR
ncbi:DUF1574 domain-containing protein [Hymenobacter aerilatus]|uniref:DUF1574 domain-containing protein n=1 Tax=Hymenobacter aerilatus TaxID=2932251 RepID=A0A8T9T054_9BACT|nr:DUF1574 domain-containing protein [Hymenobacter aerilatus]UOR05870.1 DUF1574 domain-containing protein [Hymenobacter aerilatus]